MIQVITEDSEDRFNLSLISFCSIGFLMEVSNLFIIHAGIYWTYKFRDTDIIWTPESNVSFKLLEELQSYFTLIDIMVPIAVIASDIMFLRKWNTAYKMIACFIGYICMFLLIITFTIIDTDSWQGVFFYIIIALGLILSLLRNLLIATLMFLCSGFPLVYITAITSGQAICGILSSITQIIILLVDASPKTSGLLYFNVAVVCLIITFITFLVSLKYSKLFRYRMKQLAERQKNLVNPELPLIASVFRRQRVIFFTLILMAGSTSMIQPDLTSTINSMGFSKGSQWNDTYFVPVITFLVFYICDLCGKVAALRVADLMSNTVMFVLSICRLILVPLLLIFNVTVRNQTGYVFKSDTLYIIFELLLGVTNGLGINICIVNASRKYQDIGAETAFTVILILMGVLVADVFSSFKPLIAKLI